VSECVIYKILNKANGKFYIGSTNKVSRRWTHHKSNLKYNRHCNQKLQRAYNKYGKDNFEFSIISEVEESNLLLEEQKYLDTLKPFGENGYNISKFAGSPMKGKSHTQEVKELLSRKLSGVNHPQWGKEPSETHRMKISDANKRFTDEQEFSFWKRNEAGESKNSIAREFGIHPTNIKRAIDRAKRFHEVKKKRLFS